VRLRRGALQGCQAVVDHERVESLEATTALPYENLARATAGLRGQLRLQLLEECRTADWNTFTVMSPTRVLDDRGRPWFEYRGTVATVNVS
jgi:hypothetical protein